MIAAMLKNYLFNIILILILLCSSVFAIDKYELKPITDAIHKLYEKVSIEANKPWLE